MTKILGANYAEFLYVCTIKILVFSFHHSDHIIVHNIIYSMCYYLPCFFQMMKQQLLRCVRSSDHQLVNLYMAGRKLAQTLAYN